MISSLLGRDIKIGLFRSHTIQHIDFSYHQGGYSIYGDSILLGQITPGDFVAIYRSDTEVKIKKGALSLGIYDTIYLRPNSINNVLILRPRSPILKEKKYQDAFLIFSKEEGLTIVNKASMTHYLEGVIESEGGGGRAIEYYKAQAVISRTYALRNIDRHSSKGFSLCNTVHCQVYHHMLLYTNEIRKAVESTKGIYMVYPPTGEIIASYFSANCGGETSRADFVWRNNVPYLQPVVDTFCVHSFQATWTKKIRKEEWKNFLVKEYYYPIQDKLYRSKIYSFSQKHRKAFYISPSLGIPLRDIRHHFHLKSTFFSCHPQGNYVVLKGRGFGHAVGLCQEGAMGMANAGMKYQDILSYYYTGIEFRSFFEDLYFKQVPKDILNF